ncbi:hypothetical protein DSECCO2_633450 [anaerobic digester metagenome]
MFLHPQTEAGQRCCDCRDTECQTLQWRISPWLIVRRKKSQIQTCQKLIIRLVKHPVIAVEICRDKQYLDLIAAFVLQVQLPYSPYNRIPVGVVEHVGTVCGIAGKCGYLINKLLIGTIVP